MIWKRKSSKEEIELVSLHIPKTAGTSFRHILYQIYGEGCVTRVDIPLVNKKLKIYSKKTFANSLPNKTKVIHGHFTPESLYEYFPELANIPLITWIRDPVERVVSNYFYLEKRLKEELDEEGKSLDILSKMQRSLIEYASDEINQNRISKFIGTISLDRFDFIGLVENMTGDLDRLSRLLHWGSYSQVHHNSTNSRKRDIDDAILNEIARMNQKDVELYNEVRARNKGSEK